MEEIVKAINDVLGDDPKHYTVWQTALRALIIYVSMILMVRWGHKRFMGRSTAFDIILGFVIGSVMSRAINGTAAFVPTITAGFVLIWLHWVFAWIAFHSPTFGSMIKGSPSKLVDKGRFVEEHMRSHHVTKDDVIGSIRKMANTDDISELESAYLETSGDISGVYRKQQIDVKEIRVENGVQVIRIEMLR